MSSVPRICLNWGAYSMVLKLRRHTKKGKSKSVFAEKLLKLRHCKQHHYLILFVFIKHVCPKISPYSFHTTKIEFPYNKNWCKMRLGVVLKLCTEHVRKLASSPKIEVSLILMSIIYMESVRAPPYHYFNWYIQLLHQFFLKMMSSLRTWPQ